jgi:hypothetical protein
MMGFIRALSCAPAVLVAVAAAEAWGADVAAGCPPPISGLGSGTVYYVSPSGSDSSPGTSPCAPWQSMAKVDSFGPKPGDTIAFEGAQTFTASLSPWAGVQGNSSQPIYFTSYSRGQANLAGGIYLNSVDYLTFSNLNITNSGGAGIGTGGSGSGASNIVVSANTISSSYSGGIGGYGIGLRNPLDSQWTITGDTISSTADSGVFSEGTGVTIENDALTSNGIGPYCGTGIGHNECHAIYAKGPDTIVIGNTISNPQDVGVSLRYQNDVVQANTVSGGQKGIAFSSETTTPGTTHILGNTVSGQSDTGIETYSGTRPLYESFVIADNTVYDPVNYGLYLMSGPNSGTSQTLALANNLVQIGSATRGYLNLASPFGYTKSTYTEHYDLFYGAGNSTPYYVGGSARTWKAYSNWFGAGSEGHADITKSDPRLNTTTFALGTGSPAIGAGTATVPGITYSYASACPISPSTTLLQWSYCGTAAGPNLGSH